MPNQISHPSLLAQCQSIASSAIYSDVSEAGGSWMQLITVHFFILIDLKFMKNPCK